VVEPALIATGESLSEWCHGLGCYKLVVTAGDGISVTAQFRVK